MLEQPGLIAMTMNIEQDERKQLLKQLATLKQDHRELDLAITDIDSRVQKNQLEIKRLKKQKLHLKDMISRLESSLIPDLHA